MLEMIWKPTLYGFDTCKEFAEAFRLNSDAFMIERYALDNAGVWKAFQTFVAKETKDFDRLTMSLHPDHAQTANNVLAQCMNFYESDKLDKYVRGTVMK